MDDGNAPDVAEFTADEAREHTDKIRSWANAGWEMIRDAYQRRAWAVLGYQSWDAYCHVEFQGVQLRLPREDRTQVVTSLREAGLSIRAIASATGLGDKTVQRDLRDGPGVVNDYTSASDNGTPAEPARVTGSDGKSYAPTRPSPARPAAFQSPFDKSRPASTPPPGPAPPQQPNPAVTDWVESDTNIQDLQYVAEFAKAIARWDDFAHYDPERIGRLVDHDMWASVEDFARQVNRFVDDGRRARRSLRVVGQQ